ncbi:MAG: molybdenum cofactor guanylyltransferase [Syntrophales bacterium]
MERSSTHHDMYRDITGVILVGGKSRRMGRDKAFLQVAGKTFFERVLEIFGERFDRVMLVGDQPERFAGYGLPVVPDIYPGSALGGLYTGLYRAETKFIFVSSCDIAFPNSNVLHFLCSARAGFDAVVPHTERGFEPLFALYAKSCIASMRNLLESGNMRIRDCYPQIAVNIVHGKELARVDGGGRSFVNINTPEDFHSLCGWEPAHMHRKVGKYGRN